MEPWARKSALVAGCLFFLGVIVFAPRGDADTAADVAVEPTEPAAASVGIGPSMFPTFSEPTYTPGTVGVAEPDFDAGSHGDEPRSGGRPGF